MKQFRFTFIVVIALVMAFTFCGCKDKKAAAGEAAETEEQQTETPDEATQAKAEASKDIAWNVSLLPAKIDLFQYSASESGYLIEKDDARIWGWSRDGKVAYSLDSERSSFVGIVPNGHFYIFDAVSDSVIYELNMDENWTRMNSGNNDLLSLENLYKFYWTDISNALKTNNIAIGQKHNFSRFPIKRNNMEYECQLSNISYGTHDMDFFNSRFVSNYYVVITANDKKKVIGNYPSSERDPGAIYICGYFLSPFEERALVVVAEEAYNFEGESRLTYRLNGCHLGVGFN